jgi:hypothetical protein
MTHYRTLFKHVTPNGVWIKKNMEICSLNEPARAELKQLKIINWAAPRGNLAGFYPIL